MSATRSARRPWALRLTRPLIRGVGSSDEWPGKSERVIRTAECVLQMAHPRHGDLQRPGPPRTAQTEAEFHLADHETLPRRGLQRFKLGVIMRQPDVLDVSRPTPRGPHDLDPHRPEAVFTVRTYATRRDYEPRLVRKFPEQPHQTCSSQRYGRADSAPLR